MLADLKDGIADLLDDQSPRHKLFQKLHSAVVWQPLLEEHLEAIKALPPAVLDAGLPLAQQLLAQDHLHDGHGRASRGIVDAHDQSPFATPELRAAAARIRAAFVPSKAELQAPYVDEGRRAHERHPQLKQLKADLMLFPVAGGRTLYDWVEAFLEAGEQLYILWRERAGVTGPEARGPVGVLRSQTLGDLERLRAAIAVELRAQKRSKKGHLPENTAEQVFAYLDQLASKREELAPAAPLPPDPPVAMDGGTGDAGVALAAARRPS
jgi:hypothetical protein